MFFGICMNDFGLKKRSRPLAVPRHLSCQCSIHIIQGLGKFLVIVIFLCNLCIARHAVCQQQDRIIRGSIPVHGNHVISVLDILAKRFFEQFFGNAKIGGQKTQHRTHIWMNHPRTFAHAAHRHRLSIYFKSHCSLFGLGIRRHNGARRFFPACYGITELIRHGLHSKDQLFHRKLHPNDACGRHQHLFCRNARHTLHRFCRLAAIFHALRPGAGIGNPRINDYCLRAFFF